MTETFKDLYNDMILLFPPKSEAQAEIHRNDLWEELKFDAPILRQIFKEVKRSWKHNNLPPISEFIDKKKEVKYGQREKESWHKTDEKGNPHPECNCDGCIVEKRAKDGMCLNTKCDNKRTLGDEFCDECHLVAKAYYCLCDKCRVYREIKAEKVEHEKV